MAAVKDWVNWVWPIGKRLVKAIRREKNQPSVAHNVAHNVNAHENAKVIFHNTYNFINAPNTTPEDQAKAIAAASSLLAYSGTSGLDLTHLDPKLKQHLKKWTQHALQELPDEVRSPAFCDASSALMHDITTESCKNCANADGVGCPIQQPRTPDWWCAKWRAE
ncbi:MAG TPA: hypothetical protein VMW23_02190 [Sedimentisphaerales bacterium]|nr:hypothetical protein [Sedimentisphaerales bacterium]